MIRFQDTTSQIDEKRPDYFAVRDCRRVSMGKLSCADFEECLRSLTSYELRWVAEESPKKTAARSPSSFPPFRASRAGSGRPATPYRQIDRRPTE